MNRMSSDDKIALIDSIIANYLEWMDGKIDPATNALLCTIIGVLEYKGTEAEPDGSLYRRQDW